MLTCFNFARLTVRDDSPGFSCTPERTARTVVRFECRFRRMSGTSEKPAETNKPITFPPIARVARFLVRFQ